MGFCDDREDIYSISLTVVASLLRKYNIDPRTIGRLEVGTETILDKSKSVKSVLMQLFQNTNRDIVGVDSLNACYGGTNALFNAVNWIESRAWDGRLAIVVTADIAVYAKGNARPTGGAGAVAMLVGPDASIVLDPVYGTYMDHVYDFYKPDLTSEFPYVDGQYSVKCYTEAVDACYRAYNAKYSALANGMSAEKGKLGVDRFAYAVFHAPNCKLVQKSYARLLYNDYLVQPDHPLFKGNVPDSVSSLSYEASLSDKGVEKAFMTLSKDLYAERVKAGILAPTMVGNMYSATVYAGLVSLIDGVGEGLEGKRASLFSYGSGLASTLFSVTFRRPNQLASIRQKHQLDRTVSAANASLVRGV